MKIIRTLLPLALISGLFTAAAVPAVASAASAAPAHTTVTKPSVPAPPTGVAVGTVRVPKPAGSHAKAANPMAAWSVTLTASSTSMWPTQYTTLTATASNDVGPTPYYIYIYNNATGAVVGQCGSGTTCSVALTSNTPGYQVFSAFISDSADTNGSHALAFSRSIEVDWVSVDLSLAANLHTLPTGNVSTLTETSSADIGPSPFYVQIWDTTTGAFLVECGFGTTCSTTVSQSVATTHGFIATFAASSRSYPPTLPQSASGKSYVTWTGSGMTISLTAPAVTVNGPGTVTATTNVNVGPTPYYIEIFDEAGSRIALCSTGTVCSTGYYAGRHVTSNLVAFISSADTAQPPANIQASSNTATMLSEYIG